MVEQQKLAAVPLERGEDAVESVGGDLAAQGIAGILRQGRVGIGDVPVVADGRVGIVPEVVERALHAQTGEKHTDLVLLRSHVPPCADPEHAIIRERV